MLRDSDFFFEPAFCSETVSGVKVGAEVVVGSVVVSSVIIRVSSSSALDEMGLRMLQAVEEETGK